MFLQVAYYSSIIASVLFFIVMIYFLFSIESLPWKYKRQDELNSADGPQDHAPEFALYAVKFHTILFILLLIMSGAIWSPMGVLRMLSCGVIVIAILSSALFWRQRLFQRSYSGSKRLPGFSYKPSCS